MKKALAILIAVLLTMSVFFVACSKNEDENNGNNNSSKTTDKSSDNGVLTPDTEFGFEKDAEGNDVLVQYEKDKKGKVIAHVIGNDGKKTNVTVPANNYNKNEEAKNNPSNITEPETIPNVTTTNPNTSESVTNNTADEKGTTNPELTTLPMDKIKIPTTDATGKPVQFKDRDILSVQKLLEVPYLYTASYESKDGVPINIARHVALWMAESDGNQSTSFPGGTTVINLFIYFNQTVTNFKTGCNNIQNDSHPAPIKYNPGNDIFTISSYEEKTHSIEIKEIEDLGNNNFYKVTASVKPINGSDCKSTKVVAVIQKTKLNPKYDYTFSLKALKWS